VVVEDGGAEGPLDLADISMRGDGLQVVADGVAEGLPVVPRGGVGQELEVGVWQLPPSGGEPEREAAEDAIVYRYI
jgi:hypothetical protein